MSKSLQKYAPANIVGQRFGRLLVTSSHDGRFPSIRKYVCHCDCGSVKAIAACSLVGGVTQSCGCWHKEVVTSHGHSGAQSTSTYYSWTSMKDRCLNANNPAYKYYGGRGVTVCHRWVQSFQNFLDDMGERPQGMTLDRCNDSLVYSKSTCKWSTLIEQQENRRVTIRVAYQGSLIPLMRASEAVGINYGTLGARYRRGLRGTELFSTHNLKSHLH